MSASTIPYALRQNKYVDRRVFVDLLRLFRTYKYIENHVYISLGGPSLEDQKLVHMELGIKNLISLDESSATVDRQLFNMPIGVVKCLHRTTKQFIDQMRSELVRNGCAEDSNLIVWFDYTNPRKIGQQIQEFEALLASLEAGDIVRITINAHAPAVYTANSRPSTQRETAEEAQNERYKRLSDRLGENLPSDASPQDMTDERLPGVLAKAFGLAALDALPTSSTNEFLPLSIIRYADGQQMLSITGAIVPRGERELFFETTSFKDWDFYSQTWGDLHKIDIPYLTIRERLFLDQLIPGLSPKQMRRKLRFLFDGDLDRTLEILAQYKQYYRYYPHFHHVNF